MSGKTTVVLGGGIGGVVAASRLRKQLWREHRVILVEREANHLFRPSLALAHDRCAHGRGHPATGGAACAPR